MQPFQSLHADVGVIYLRQTVNIHQEKFNSLNIFLSFLHADKNRPINGCDFLGDFQHLVVHPVKDQLGIGMGAIMGQRSQEEESG